jgi:hypothetical protein
VRDHVSPLYEITAKIIVLNILRPTILKTEEDSRSQRLEERKSQGEVDLNSQGWQLPKGANPYRKPGKSRGPEVADPSLDYSATDWYSVLRNY